MTHSVKFIKAIAFNSCNLLQFIKSHKYAFLREEGGTIYRDGRSPRTYGAIANIISCVLPQSLRDSPLSEGAEKEMEAFVLMKSIKDG